MRFPLTFWDISLWLAVTAIILLALTTTFATAAITREHHTQADKATSKPLKETIEA